MTTDQEKKLKEALHHCQQGRPYPACNLIWQVLCEQNPFSKHWKESTDEQS